MILNNLTMNAESLYCNFENLKQDCLFQRRVQFISKLVKKANGAHFNRGIKHDFPFINIRMVPREVLKPEEEARGFQPSPRNLANVNE